MENRKNGKNGKNGIFRNNKKRIHLNIHYIIKYIIYTFKFFED